MTNTALSAEPSVKPSRLQDTTNTHMIFSNKEHEEFFYEKLSLTEHQDCYHKSLIYLLGVLEDTRDHFDRIYNIKTDCIRKDCLYDSWQSGSSIKVVRLAFNLYTNGMPDVNEDECREEQVRRCREYSVSDIFCCSQAMYFWEGIRLRYPEYCRKQRSVQEILAGMKERKRAEDSIDGNKK